VSARFHLHNSWGKNKEEKFMTMLERFAKHVALATPQGKRLHARLLELTAQRDVERNRADAAEGQCKAERSRADAALAQCQLERERAAIAEARFTEEGRRVDTLNQTLQRYGDVPPFVPNGHFYSPIHAMADVQRDRARLFAEAPASVPGIDLRTDAQLELLRRVGEIAADHPFTDHAEGGRRYGFDNTAYSYGDALCLHGMLRLLRPARLIEVGSGHSSCMTLDTRDLFLNSDVQCTFIEPYPELLYSLLKPGDLDTITVLPDRVQDVNLEVFQKLQAGDVLFIDSTHVSKIGSDVNRLYFDVLPSLASGVCVHIHDIFYPFEYPSAWIDEGRAWNEQYILRGLLQDSSGFEILLFNNYLARCWRDTYVGALPLAAKNPGGSIWLRRL
jgi:hypothetical protein